MAAGICVNESTRTLTRSVGLRYPIQPDVKSGGMELQQAEKENRGIPTQWFPWLLVVVGVLVYVNSLWGPFIYDDRGAIMGNKHIRQLWPLWRTMSAPPQSPLAGRPVVSVSLAINYCLGKLDPRGYHAGNIAIHVLCTLVLFGIVRRTLLSERLRPQFGRAAGPLALVCALIWMVHPLQTECVNYITQRTESIMGLFYLLTLYGAIRAIDSGRPYRWYGASVLACALGMASKEVMVTAPVMVLLYDRVFGSGSAVQVLRRRWALYAGLAATWVILAALMWSGPRSDTVGFFHSIGASTYAGNQCLIILHYLRLAFWPHPLALDYGLPALLPIRMVAPYAAVLAALLIATLAALIYRPMVGFLMAWVFVILAPTSSFIPITSEVGAERRMYLSLAGLVVIVVSGVYVLLERAAERLRMRQETAGGPIAGGVQRRVGTVLTIAVTAVLAWTTVRRNHDYRSEASIWQTVVQARPHNSRAHDNLGVALHLKGELGEAIRHFRQALRIAPNDPRAHLNLGNALGAQGKTGEAIEHFREALKIKPDYAKARNNLAGQLIAQGRSDEAISHLHQALQIEPDYVVAHNNLGNALTSQGKFDEAIGHYRRALEIDPGYANAHNNLANALRSQGKFDEAITHYRKALEFKPHIAKAHYNLAVTLKMVGNAEEAIKHFGEALHLEPNWLAPLNDIAWIRATHPDPEVRNAGQAIEFAERACELTGHKEAAILDTLAAAYAEAGRFGQAVTTARAAITLAEKAQAKELAEAIGKRLELYRQERPYREVLRPQSPLRP